MSAAPSSFVRGLLFDHWPQKVIALALATVLVFVKREDQSTVMTATVRVAVSHPKDRVLVSPLVDKVLITLEGKYSTLRKLDLETVPPLEINLSGTEGEQVTFEPEMFKVPPGVQVRAVRPPAMLVAFEERKRAKVPVEPKFEGQPQSGFQVNQVTVQPPTVVIEGAASAVDAIRRVETEPISLVGRNQTTTLSKRLQPAPSAVGYLDGGRTYEVSINIEERRATRVVTGRAIEVINLPEGVYGFEVTPSTVDITLHGPVRLLDNLDPDMLIAKVDLTGVRPRRVLRKQRVQFEAPEGLTYSELKPSVVTLLRKEPPEPEPEPAPDAGVQDEPEPR